jgi:hypothetical protein
MITDMATFPLYSPFVNYIFQSLIPASKPLFALQKRIQVHSLKDWASTSRGAAFPFLAGILQTWKNVNKRFARGL